MNEMVERAAIAVCPWNGKKVVGCPTSCRACLSTAIAAFRAMREPTEGMCAAGQKVNNLSDEPGAFEFLSRDEMTAAWQAMVDEMLK